MKLPLWVKDRNGKYHRFPYEALTWQDGRYIVEHRDLAPFLELCEATGWDIHQFFDYSINSINWGSLVLKEKAGE